MLYSATGRNFLIPLVANAFLGGALSIAVYFLARQQPVPILALVRLPGLPSIRSSFSGRLAS